MSSKDTKILEFNQYRKPRFVIYADLECLIYKFDGCKNNPDNLSTTEVGKHIPSGFSMSTISLFKKIENKYNVYRGKDCMKKFCKSLQEHAMKLLTSEQLRSYKNAKSWYIFDERFEDRDVKYKKYCKVRNSYYYPGEYRGTPHSIM